MLKDTYNAIDRTAGQVQNVWLILFQYQSKAHK